MGLGREEVGEGDGLGSEITGLGIEMSLVW